MSTITVRSVKRWEWLVLLASAIVYLALAIANLDLPGLYYDEVLQVLPAMNIVGYDVGQDFYYVPRSIINLGARPFPMLIMPYTGALEVAIFVPVLGLFGVSTGTIRLAYIVLGLAAIALTFVWTRRVFDRRFAAIATLLMATDAGYILVRTLAQANGEVVYEIYTVNKGG